MPSKEAMKAAKRIELCSGCEMAGRMCDDCLEYEPCRINIATALDAFAAARVAEERKLSLTAWSDVDALLSPETLKDMPASRIATRIDFVCMREMDRLGSKP